MSGSRRDLGLSAEEATVRWLSRCGWRVIGRRQRAKGGGEVDILALDEESVLVAVEVRARRTPRSGTAAASVDGRKVAGLRRALAAHAATCGQPHRGLRVDLVTAEPATGSRNAWRLARTPNIG